VGVHWLRNGSGVVIDVPEGHWAVGHPEFVEVDPPVPVPSRPVPALPGFERVVVLMPSFGECLVRARNERFVLSHYDRTYNVPVVRGGGLARAHALNAAARAAAREHPARDVFVLCDNDLIPDQQRMLEALRAVDKFAAVTPHAINRNLSERATVTFMEDGEVTNWSDTPKGAKSFVVIRREVYAGVNGLDEKFVGWGPEDASFMQSVKKQAGEVLHLDGVRLHLWHPTDPTKRDERQLGLNRSRFRRYRSNRPEVVRMMAREYGRWDDERKPVG
jgi:hypothetical protein